jgi:putative ABC transport system permease protein
LRLGGIAARNLRRNRLRSALTIAGVAAAVLAFVLIRTVVWAWTVQTADTASDRVVTRHRVTFVMNLPRRYIDEVRALPGVKVATFANWFGGKDPNHENEFFATIACDPKTHLEVYEDMRTPPEQAKAWIEDRQGALVGEALMKRLGWKLGQTIRLQSQIFPGEWELRVVAVYEALRKSVDPAQVFFHWDVLNERMRERGKDKIGWIVTRVEPGVSAVDTSLAIDRAFEASDVQTLSQDERTFQKSFLAMFSAILTALDIVSVVVLGIMMLILGNTVAMGVRERTGEFAVLRAIGFLPRHVVALVVGEAAALGLAGGAVGLGIAYPFIDHGLGRFIEENMGQFFPFFHLTPENAGLAIGLAVALGVLSSAPPAVRAYRLHVVDALRRVA